MAWRWSALVAGLRAFRRQVVREGVNRRIAVANDSPLILCRG